MIPTAGYFTDASNEKWNMLSILCMLVKGVVPGTKHSLRAQAGYFLPGNNWAPEAEEPTSRWRMRGEPILPFQRWSGKSLYFSQFFNACSLTPQGLALTFSIMTDKESDKDSD